MKSWMKENRKWLARNMAWCGIACSAGVFFAVLVHFIPVNLLEAVWYGMAGGQSALAAAKAAFALCAVGSFAIAAYGQALWVFTSLTETLGSRASIR